MKVATGSGRLDFDLWVNAAAEDPAAFERMRRQEIARVIARAPAAQRERLRRLQWRVDLERSRSDNPLGACVRISRMMWNSFSGEGGLLELLGTLRRGEVSKRVLSPVSAEIVPFTPGDTRPR